MVTYHDALSQAADALLILEESPAISAELKAGCAACREQIIAEIIQRERGAHIVDMRPCIVYSATDTGG